MADSILGLVLEVEFHPLYQDQKLFGELSQFLSDQGFHFIKFTRILEFSPYRAPLGLRGEGFQVAGDALFLRRSETLKAGVEHIAVTRLKLFKLAFLAVVFGQLEYALMVLDQRESLGQVDPGPDLEHLTYGEFLSELHEASKRVPKAYQPTFGERFSYESSKARFQPLDHNETVASTTAPREPRPLRRLARKAKGTLRRRLPRLGAAFRAFKANGRPLADHDTEVEALLKEYGLVEQARLLKTRRGGSGR